MNESTPSIEKHLTVDKSDQTILDCLSENCPQISKQKLKLAMKYGAVWITPHSPNKSSSKTTRIRRAKKILSKGDEVHLYYDDKILFSEIVAAQLIADEGEYSLWNKPCGMFSQGTKWGDHSSIARWVELFGLLENDLPQKPCFLVHRLDRATNGLIVVAHSKKMASQLARLFEERKIEKHYTALVRGEYPSNSQQQILNQDIDNKTACSIILSSQYRPENNLTCLIIKIETGRKHQIRRHLSTVGFPIIGDRLYASNGNENRIDSGLAESDLMLGSCFLKFKCPATQVDKQYSLPSY